MMEHCALPNVNFGEILLFRTPLKGIGKSGIFCLRASTVRSWNTVFSTEIGIRLKAEVIERSSETQTKKVAALPHGGATCAIGAQYGVWVCFVAQFLASKFGGDLSIFAGVMGLRLPIGQQSKCNSSSNRARCAA